MTAELYESWVEHKTIAALVEGRLLSGTFPATEVIRNQGCMWWSPTAATTPLCTVTVDGPGVSVDVSAVLTHLEGCTLQDRALVIDDVLDGLIGSEYYLPEWRAQWHAKAKNDMALRGDGPPSQVG
ncbi:hypothetical protein [Salinactinospora qingdaonensis]|uniref:hypothetical protein n=1 Tax=Salinactinospora qingdaonensis TaxID=702744 RepID=UPI0031E9F49B